MKTKRLRRALALLLVMLLCFSVITPAVSAGSVEQAATGADGDVLEKHADNPSVTKANLQTLFGDSTGVLNTAFYGFAPVPEPDTALDTSTITYVTGTSNIEAGNWLALKTTANGGGSLIGRKPNWDDESKRSQLNFSVRTYYTASFTVNGSADGALYLNDEAVSGNVNLFTDAEYTVTAADVEGFTREVNGVTLGEAFTPNADMTITADYTADASAAISLTVGEGGTAKIISDGAQVTGDTIPAGKLFTVEATPNTNRGYKTESIIVTKNGEAIESGDGIYGPVADGEEYAITVSFKYDPDHVEKEVIGTDAKVSRTDLSNFLGSYSYYGIAPASDPDNITQLVAVLSPNYNVQAGEYIIYATNDNTGGLLPSPIWTNAKLMVLDVRVYYNGTFTVTGNDEGEVYLNGESVTGSKKLYTDAEYTVTAKNIDDYVYTIDGAEDGAAFTPSSNVNVNVNYLKKAYATFTVNANEGGTVTVSSNGDVVTDRISEGNTFTVEAAPNTNRGYKLDSIVVKKGDEEVVSVDGVYGPVADEETYEITVTFRFDPDVVDYEMDANNTKLYVTDFYNMFDQELGTYSYGFSSIDDPGNITTVGTLAGATISAGEYYIYRTSYSLTNPNWNNAKIYRLNLRSYYNGTFTVNGHDEGEVYLNGESVTGSKKLYTDTEYTVTAKDIEEYGYVMDGAENGTAFTPTADVNVTVTYTKLAYATFTLNANEGGTAEVQVNGEAVTDRVSEGDSFTVNATPNTDRGYKVDKITVVNGENEIQPDESGAYGPVADGEQYFITVTFKFDPDVVDYEFHEGTYLTSTLINSMFGGSALDMFSKSFGFAKADTPDEITNATIIGDKVEAGEYYIYRTGISTNPNWANAKILKLNLRTYYDATFTVTAPEEMPESGALYLNGADVTGAQKLYTDTEYTVTAKAVEGYIYTVYSIEEGAAFTPAEDIEVSAVYMKETYATVDVTANEGGTVKIMSDGAEVFDKVPEGSTFTISATADADNDYYVESIVVKKNGEDYEPGDGIYGPVLDQENYEVTVTFAKATLSLDDCDVVLIDIRDKKFAEIEQSILANVTLTPEMFADDAQFKVEYAAYKVLALDIYAPLNYNTTLSHAFGTSELGGELLDGNTEKIRVTCTIPSRNIEMTAYATATVKDVREATEIAGEFTTITYGDDLKAALMPTITVTDSNGDPVAFTADDITVSPASLNVRLLSAQEVTIRYNGNDYYAASENTVNVYVRQAQSSLDTKSETITYGETPEAKVITTPENLDYIKVIAGIDGDAQGFVSIDIPNSVKERMKIKVGDLVLLDIYQILSDRIGEGSTINDLKALILDIYNRIDSNEAIKQALEASGFNMEILDNIMGFIEELPDSQSSLRIRLNQVPENAGAYLLFAVSTDINYTVSADLSTIIIKPQTEEEGGAYELRFKAEMQGEGNLQFLDYDEAQDFTFGGDFYIGDTLTETENLHTLYVGTTLKGDLISQEEPVREPGVYVETVYYQESNKWVTPIIRSYTINRIETELKMDDLTVAYDGEAHALTAYLEDAEIVEDNLTYSYVGSGYIGSEAPVNAGEYTVYAFYTGDDTHMAASVLAKLTITKLDATITVTCTEEVTYGDINFFNAAEVANIQYTVDGTINDDELGLIVPTLSGQGLLTVGEYNATVTFIQTNPNYNVTIENATLTIIPREIILTIDDMEKTYGDDDPAYSYTIVDGEGREINAYAIGLTITREEGEDIGEYAISASIRDNVNNTLTYSPASLTITAKPIIVTIDDSTKEHGKIDPVFTYAITDSQGNAIDPAEVRLTIARDVGEDIGEYEIFVARVGNKNYVLDTENSKEGTLTIEPAKRGYILGDVDGDGEVEPLDATWIQRMLALVPLGDFTFDELAADVDGDGDVTTVDATLIQRYLAHMPVDYPIGETQYEDIE